MMTVEALKVAGAVDFSQRFESERTIEFCGNAYATNTATAVELS